jgi:Fur family ferric uptake transcriptional regulator
MESTYNFKYEILLKNFKELLKKSGLKFTSQREAILETLYEMSGHYTPEDLHVLIKQRYPELNIGIATVYRTLNLLENSNMATSISFGTAGKKFEIGTKPHHDHMICKKCGEIIEFEDKEIEKRQQIIAKKHGFELTGHIMQLYGICKKCQLELSKQSQKG